MNRIAELLADSLGPRELNALGTLATNGLSGVVKDAVLDTLADLRLVEPAQGSTDVELTRLGWDVLSLGKSSTTKTHVA